MSSLDLKKKFNCSLEKVLVYKRKNGKNQNVNLTYSKNEVNSHSLRLIQNFKSEGLSIKPDIQ